MVLWFGILTANTKGNPAHEGDQPTWFDKGEPRFVLLCL